MNAKYAAQRKARGAPRAGEALSQGMRYCGACGHRMRVAYKPAIRYHCDGLKRHYADIACMSLDGSSIEEVAVQAFFEALSPAQLDALEALPRQRHQEETRLEHYWRDQVSRATYQAQMARRRYEAVDPYNRLVAAELDLWASGKISTEHKKRLLRSLISRVIATRLAPDCVEIKMVWISGHFSVAQVIPPIHRQADVSNYVELVERIDELTKKGLTDPQIAAQLTAEGLHTARRLAVTVGTIHKLRLRHGQVSLLHQHRRVAMVDGSWD